MSVHEIHVVFVLVAKRRTLRIVVIEGFLVRSRSGISTVTMLFIARFAVLRIPLPAIRSRDFFAAGSATAAVSVRSMQSKAFMGSTRAGSGAVSGAGSATAYLRKPLGEGSLDSKCCLSSANTLERRNEPRLAFSPQLLCVAIRNSFRRGRMFRGQWVCRCPWCPGLLSAQANARLV